MGDVWLGEWCYKCCEVPGGGLLLVGAFSSPFRQGKTSVFPLSISTSFYQQRYLFFSAFVYNLKEIEASVNGGYKLTDPGIVFSIGPITIRWYGLIITSAVLIGYVVAYWRVKSRGQNPDHLSNILIYGLISALVGARLYYVIFSFSNYVNNPAEIFAI